MLRRDLLRAAMTTPLAGWLGRWMLPALGGVAVEGPDASTIYGEVFGWGRVLPSEDRERLARAATVPLDDPRIDALIRQARPVLRAIRKAAAIGRCRWETEMVACEDLNQGHLDVFNLDVIRAACLAAHRHAASGRGRAALNDVFAGLTLAHRIGTGGVLFARVLECGGEVPAFQTLGRILPDLNRASLDDLSRRLEALPPPEPASATIGPESRCILGSIRTKLMAIGPTIAGPDWREVGFDAEEAAALRRLTGGDRDRLLTHLETTDTAFAELARRLDLPRPGCLAALDEFARAWQARQPIAAGLVESAWGIRHVVDRMRALRAMLHAGLALIRGGEPAFLAQPDPFGPGPFVLERRGKGYLICSALNDAGKPEVSLEIGEAA